jgi:hypothetical protein
LSAFSIADIAAETASFAGCFCAIVPALSLIAAASPKEAAPRGALPPPTPLASRRGAEEY